MGECLWQSVNADLGEFFDQIHKNDSYSSHIFVDNTATDEVPEHYNKWLEAGCHVVTPNKKFGSGSLPRYKAGHRIRNMHGSHFHYEVTCIIKVSVMTVDSGDSWCWTTSHLYPAESTRHWR